MRIKSPYVVYLLALSWLLMVLSYRTFLHTHPAAELYVLTYFFWIFNVATLLVGIVWWRDNKPVTGAIGIFLSLVMAILYFV